MRHISSSKILVIYVIRLFATKRSDEPKRKVATILLDILALLMQLSAYVIVLASMKSECVKTPSVPGETSTPVPGLAHARVMSGELFYCILVPFTQIFARQIRPNRLGLLLKIGDAYNNIQP